MKTIFHAGHAKTGSTTLQSVFLASQEILAGQGVLYPANPNGRYNNHKLLSTDLMTGDRVPRHVLKNYAVDELSAAADELVTAIRADVARLRPECLVLSSETSFGVLPQASAPQFRDRLESLGSRDIDIAIYVRRPAAWYLSALNQRMRRAVALKTPRTLNLRGSVSQFSDLFGPEHVKLMAFDRDAMAGGDIVEDFCTRFLSGYGVTAAALDRGTLANESVSNETLDVIRRYRATFLPDQDDKFVPEGERLLKAAIAAEQTLTMPKPALQPEIRDAVEFGNRHILWLRDTHGLELPGYDYARAESGDFPPLTQEGLDLADVIVIDRAAQMQVIHALAGSDWVQQDETRRAWFAALPQKIAEETGAAIVHPASAPDSMAQTSSPETAGEPSMTDETDDMKTDDGPGQSTDRKLAQTIGRAIFRAESKTSDMSAEDRKAAWKAERKTYVRQGNMILKQLRKNGFTISSE